MDKNLLTFFDAFLKKCVFRCNVSLHCCVIQVNMEQHKFEIEAKRIRPAIFRLAVRYTEDTDEAEDVTLDVMLKLWFMRERLDGYRSIDALAMVITKHLCLNRKRGIHVERVGLEEGLYIMGDETPERMIIKEERMEELLALIATLPDLQQAILRMKHIEGFEVEEIARLTGSTPIAIRTNLSRARKKVREQFLMRNKEWN